VYSGQTKPSALISSVANDPKRTWMGGHASCHFVPVGYARSLLFSFVLILGYLTNVVSNVGRKPQWRLHTKASVFAELFTWRYPASRKQWDIAIADHADRGRVVLSMLLPFGSLKPCGSLRGRNMLPCSKRRKSVSGNTAGNAAAIL
jgi:hypothetical protein